MIVLAQQLLDAANEMRARGTKLGQLKEPVKVTPDQLQKAGEILRDGPQPVANGIRSDMPGFIHAENQETDDVLVLDVGILPSRQYRIGRDGSLIERALERAA